MFNRVTRIGMFAIIAVVVLAGCAPATPAAPGTAREAAPQTPKRITAAIRGQANSMAQARTQRLVGSVAGIDAIEDLVQAGLTHRGIDGTLAPRLAVATPSIENGLWQLMPDGRMRTT